MIKATSDVYLYGKEINDETYAICKSDMMIKGNNPENIKVGSTLAADSFSDKKFDFMLSNPPYGKSWSSDLKHIKDGKTIIDPRFEVKLTDYWGAVEDADATPRSSDGQLLFLMEMVDKMKSTNQSSVGSRIASVHNGSSLFTGDAGGGESNIRRYIIENDLLEAIVQMPNNLFYNTGITTYIWLLSNNKADERKGKVQLIEGSLLFKKLRKNLGDKNCEFAPEHIHEIVQAYLENKEIERKIDPETNEEAGIAAKVFDNEDFGYYKVTIERPNRLKCQFTKERVETLRYDNYLEEPMRWAYNEFGDALYDDLKKFEKQILDWCEESEDVDLTKGQRKKLIKKSTWENQRKILKAAELLMKEIGTEVHSNFNSFEETVNEVLKDQKVKLSSSDKNKLFGAVTWYDESADKVIKRTKKWKPDKLEELYIHLGCTEEQLPDFGYYPSGKPNEFIEYETATDLRDTENVPLKEQIHEYFLREVKPHVDEAWIDLDKTKIGYEISFNKYFYRHKPLRDLEEVAEDILKLEEKSEGLIHEILSLT
jgi:type I restriction enzyme M protein